MTSSARASHFIKKMAERISIHLTRLLGVSGQGDSVLSCIPGSAALSPDKNIILLPVNSSPIFRKRKDYRPFVPVFHEDESRAELTPFVPHRINSKKTLEILNTFPLSSVCQKIR